MYTGALDENNVAHSACGECIERGLARFVPVAAAAECHPHVSQPHNGAQHGAAVEAHRHAESAHYENFAWGGHPGPHQPGTAAGAEVMGAACAAQRVPMGMLSRKRGAGGAAVEWGGEVFCVGQQVWTGHGAACEAAVSSPHKRQRTGVPFSPVI